MKKKREIVRFEMVREDFKHSPKLPESLLDSREIREGFCPFELDSFLFSDDCFVYFFDDDENPFLF